MDELNFETVAVKSVKGAFALVSRTFIIQVLSIIAAFILTVYLSPANYGVFFIVSAIVVFFTYFQDIGLAAALIQKKEEPTVEELRTTFTLQQVLVLTIILPALFFSSQIASMYRLDSEGQLLLVALLVSFLLSSLRTIPTVLMERHLDFKRLVIPQIAENVVYNTSLILLAVAGFGVKTFTIAVLARSIIGLGATYAVQSWPVGLSFEFKKIKHLINFGIPFQTNSLLALIKDDLLIAYVGTVLPLAQVGYIAFAQKWAFMPLRLIMDNVIKITFPSYSRLQDDRLALKLALQKSLFLVSFLIFPIAIAIILYAPYLIDCLPRYTKWEPALLALSFFALNTLFSSISTPITNLLNAIGKVNITLVFMVGWTILTWVLTPAFIFLYGFNGFAFASFVISTTSIIVLMVARRYVDFSFISPIAKQFAAAVFMGLVIFLTQQIITSFALLSLNAIFAGIVYLGMVYILNRNELVKTFGFIITSVRSKV